MKKKIIISIVIGVIIVLVARSIIWNDSLDNTKIKTMKECVTDNECPEDYRCYWSQFCSPTPKGMDCGPQTGDLKCHKECETNNGCPEDTPNCKEVQIFQGDVGSVVSLCF